MHRTTPLVWELALVNSWSHPAIISPQPTPNLVTNLVNLSFFPPLCSIATIGCVYYLFWAKKKVNILYICLCFRLSSVELCFSTFHSWSSRRMCEFYLYRAKPRGQPEHSASTDFCESGSEYPPSTSLSHLLVISNFKTRKVFKI